MKLAFVSINKLDEENSSHQIIDNVNSLREAVAVAFLNKDVDLNDPIVSEDVDSIVSNFVEYPHAFVWGGDEEVSHYFFKI